MQQSLLATTGLAFIFDQTISSNTSNYNLKSAAIAAGWNQFTPLLARITINSGVYVSANTTATPAFDTGATFPAGTLLSLVNNGFIVGMGANGGFGAGTDDNSTAGATGGLALRAQHPISINNLGTIGGGGGGAGGGASTSNVDKNSNLSVGGGGGGGGGRSGATNSSGGGAYGGLASTTGLSGQAGTLSAPGNGGAGSDGGGSGGTGGQWGSNGNSGNTITTGTLRRGPSGGGVAGAAVNGNSNITWVATGTRLGAIA